MASGFKSMHRRKQVSRRRIGAPTLLAVASALLAVGSVALHSEGLFLLCIFVLAAATVAALMFHDSDPLDDLLLWLFFFW